MLTGNASRPSGSTLFPRKCRDWRVKHETIGNFTWFEAGCVLTERENVSPFQNYALKMKKWLTQESCASHSIYYRITVACTRILCKPHFCEKTFFVQFFMVNFMGLFMQHYWRWNMLKKPCISGEYVQGITRAYDLALNLGNLASIAIRIIHTVLSIKHMNIFLCQRIDILMITCHRQGENAFQCAPMSR